MLTWIVLAALAQFITALIVLVDKYVLVSHAHLGKPVVYAFYVSALSGVVIVLVPFGVVSVPSLTVLEQGHASDAVHIVGAVAAAVTLYLAFLLLDQDLPPAFIPAFLLLVIGTVLISHIRLTWRSLRNVVLAGGVGR